jgi:heat shock protein HslJ
MTALVGAKAYRIEGDSLQLLSADGTVRATLAAQPQTLAGTAWHATGINNGKGAVVSLVAGSTVSLEFAADGQASGSAGCNRFTTSYQADGPRLSFSRTAATRRACGATGLMEQEQAFLKALESVATMRIEGDRLELRDARGALLASLARG